MKKLILFIGIFLITISLYAQPSKRILTFEEAVSMALKNSILLNQQRNNLILSQTQKTSAISSLGPSVSGTLSASQFNGNSFNQNAGVVVNGVRDNISGNLNASLNLFNGFNSINNVRQSVALLEAQTEFIKRTGQDMINTVSGQYLNVMLDIELLRIAQQNYEALNKQLEQVKEQVKVGSRSPVDEYNQDALTKGAELRMVQAEITLDNDKALLSQTLMMDPFEDFDVEQPSWDINVVGSQILNPEELAKQAKESRGDYLRAINSERASELGMRMMRGNMLPSLSAFFNYGSAYNFQQGEPDSLDINSTDLLVVQDVTQPSGFGIQEVRTPVRIGNPGQRSFKNQFRIDNVYKQYGIQLSIPIFNGFQSRTAYVRQRVQYENSRLDRMNIENQIKTDVIRAFRNYEGTRKAYTVTVDQLKAAQLAFDLETERYNLGVTNFVDFINANRVFVQAQTDKAQAEYRLLFQKVLLDYAVGTLKIEDFPQGQ
jgi:outer membrane protein